MLEISSFYTCVPKIYDVRFLRYEVRQTKKFVILDHFLPFSTPSLPEWSWKSKFSKKNQKMLGNILLYIYVYHKWRSYTGIYPSSFTNVHFWTKIELFECYKMQVGLSRCYKVSNKFMVEPWCGVQGIKPLKYFALFTSWGQISSLK